MSASHSIQRKTIQFTASDSSTTRPSNRWTVRFACDAYRVSCVTMQIVAPVRCSSLSRSMTASPFFESRLPVGSSASRIDGSPDTARATAAPGGFWGGQRLSMADYVTGMGATDGATAPPEGASVGYPLVRAMRRAWMRPPRADGIALGHFHLATARCRPEAIMVLVVLRDYAASREFLTFVAKASIFSASMIGPRTQEC